MTSSQYDCLLKVVLVGDAGVGKTSLFENFINPIYPTTSYNPTIGVDFGNKTIVVQSKKIKIQIWDTAGQERFRSITHNYYRGADIVILIFDLTNMESFNNVNMWYKLIKDIVKSDEKPYKYILIGNKCDLKPRRIVPIDIATEFARNNDMQYFETSYYYKDDINNIFEDITKNILLIKKDIVSSDEKAANILLGLTKGNKKQWCYLF
jgi:Ras-related protein Rab-1A